MSDSSDVHGHDEAHTGPIKNPKQLLVAVFFSFVIPIFIIIGLVYFVTSDNKPVAGAVDTEQALAQRIQKVGTVEVRDANREARSGEEVFKLQCAACHTTGQLGAPKVGVASAWAPRIKNGFATLWESALKGKNSMPAQSGGDASDYEIARAVVYMANESGAKFSEPKKPEAAPAQ